MSSPHEHDSAGHTTGQRTDADTAQALPAPAPGAVGDTMLTCSPSGPITPAPAAALVQIPGYAILGELGRGGMGVVYKARQLKADRVVALKMILSGSHAGASELNRFRTEAEALARLQHPHIVGVYDVGEHEGRPFFSLEFCDGGSLERRLDGTPLPPREAASLVEKLAQAMAAAHGKGVIHRDLKPANVLLASGVSNDPGFASPGSFLTSLAIPKITDFGLAKKLDDDSSQTGTGAVMGTPSYMAPEQAGGKARELGPACDIYALGAILYECLTGRPPFRAATALDTLLQVVSDDPVPPSRLQPKCPRDLETICLKCLQKDPARRYATAAALAEDCAAFLDGRPIRARAVGRLERLGKWVRRRPAVAALVLVSVAALLALFGGGVLYLRQTQQEKERAVSSLYHSLVGEARALRLARTDGYREECWQRLQDALQLRTPDCDRTMLRREAAGCLGDPVGRKPLAWDDLPSDIKAVAVHSAGELLAVGLADGSVSLHRRGASPVLRLPRGLDTVSGLAFVGAERRLVCAHNGGTVRIFEQNDGTWTLIKEFMTDGTFGTVGGGPRGEMLATWSEERIDLWALDRGTRLNQVSVPKGAVVQTVALSPNGRLLAAGYSVKNDQHVRVWELAGAPVVKAELHLDLATLNGLTFSPDGKLLACAGGGGVSLFETAGFTPRLSVGGDVIYSLAFSPDGRRLALHIPQTGIVRLWNVLLNREVAAFPHPVGPGAMLRTRGLERGIVRFTGTGSLVLASDQRVHLRDLSGGPEKLVLEETGLGIPDLHFHPGGAVLAAACKDRTVTLWDPRTGVRLRGKVWNLPGLAQNVAFSPDGRLVAASDWTGTLQVRDFATWIEAPLTGDPPGDLLWSLAFRPDGRVLGVAGNRGVKLWQVKPGPAAQSLPILQPLLTLSEKGARCLCFSPDGHWVAWYENAPIRLRLRDLSRQPPVELELPRDGHVSHPRSLAFLPDGRHLAVAGTGRVEVWDLTERRVSFTLGGAEFIRQTGITLGLALSLSRDGTRLAVVGDRITIWDLRSRELLLALPPEPFSVWAVAWSPDDELLAASSASGALVVWRLESIRVQLAAIGLGW